jgi:hypothetical protein
MIWLAIGTAYVLGMATTLLAVAIGQAARDPESRR